MNVIRKAMAIAAALSLTLSAGACGADESSSASSATTSATGPLTVVASVSQWGSLAEQIGGDDVTVTSILSSSGVDAHGFEPTTSDVARIHKAGILVVNGAGYDSWATKNVSSSTSVVSAAETVGAMDGDNPHLWFSKEARDGMAKEIAETFSRILPSKKKDFEARLKSWQSREKTLETTMTTFKTDHDAPVYGATEAVAYYLMSDLGFTDATPKGYANAVASEGEPSASDLQTFQGLIEKHKIDVLINNTQESSDAGSMLLGTAGRSDVPVVDVSEQIPSDAQDLVSWITSLVSSISDALDSSSGTDSASPDGTSSSSDSASPSDSESSSDSPSASSSTSTTPSNEGQTDPGK